MARTQSTWRAGSCAEGPARSPLRCLQGLRPGLARRTLRGGPGCTHRCSPPMTPLTGPTPTPYAFGSASDAGHGAKRSADVAGRNAGNCAGYPRDVSRAG
jgi:hypothetical protein